MGTDMALAKKLDWDKAQDQWAAQLDPLLQVSLTKGVFLPGVQLKTGTNTVNHRLGRKLIGWFIVGIGSPATIYDQQATNQMPDLTLVLVSNADALVNLWVF